MLKVQCYLLAINYTSSVFTNNNNDPFSVGEGFLEKLLSGISKIFSILFSIISSIVSAIEMFYKSLVDITAWIDNLITGLTTGNVDGLPVLEAIGTYRYLVGDTIFYLTYMLIVTGCLFTIYKLCLLIYEEITKMSGSSVFASIFSKMP